MHGWVGCKLVVHVVCVGVYKLDDSRERGGVVLIGATTSPMTRNVNTLHIHTTPFIYTPYSDNSSGLCTLIVATRLQ